MPDEEHDGGDRSPVQSVDRALTILEILARAGEAGLGEIADELGVHKSTVSRTVAALAAHDLVEQPESRGPVRLGPGILRLAGATTARLDLVQEGRPVCRALAEETGETVNVAVMAGSTALYVDQALGPSTITSYNWVGQHIPLHATSNGRVLLGALSPDERRAAWGELTAFTEHTVTRPAELERLVEEARSQGYAVVRDELDIGLTAMAAPVHNAHGELVASISLSGPSFRLDPDREHELLAPLRRAADDLSARLGWHG
jgi:DNA-binding IclR family transcriptional regulator